MIFSSYTSFYRKVKRAGFAAAAAQTAALGFDAVELIQSPRIEKAYIKTAADAAECKRILQANGLAITCFSLVLDLLHGERDRVLDDAYRNIELAAILGAPYFHHTVAPDFLPQPSLPLDKLLSGHVAELGELIAKRCNELGILCLYEPQGMQINGVAALSAWLAEMRARGCEVGICGDLGNSLFVDTPPAEIFTALAGEIRQIHVKDYFYSAEPIEGALRSRGGKYIAEAPIGKGDADIARCLSLIEGFDGPISMENDVDDEELQRSVAYTKALLQKK